MHPDQQSLVSGELLAHGLLQSMRAALRFRGDPGREGAGRTGCGCDEVVTAGMPGQVQQLRGEIGGLRVLRRRRRSPRRRLLAHVPPRQPESVRLQHDPKPSGEYPIR